MSMKFLDSHTYRKEIFCYRALVMNRLGSGTRKPDSVCKLSQLDTLIGSDGSQFKRMVNYLHRHQRMKV